MGKAEPQRVWGQESALSPFGAELQRGPRRRVRRPEDERLELSAYHRLRACRERSVQLVTLLGDLAWARAASFESCSVPLTTSPGWWRLGGTAGVSRTARGVTFWALGEIAWCRRHPRVRRRLATHAVSSRLHAALVEEPAKPSGSDRDSHPHRSDGHQCRRRRADGILLRVAAIPRGHRIAAPTRDRDRGLHLACRPP